MTIAPMPCDRTTTDAGIPAPSDEHSLTAGPDGPILLQDHYLIQKMAQFNRERVPERVVHAKGAGAHGYFESFEDVSDWTKAGFMRKGTRTPAFVRFSTVAGELGSADTVRDPRGFAIKLYTDEGNYDLVGNNTPIFFIRDPQKFSDFIHSQKRRADTGMRDNDMQWDFWTLSPESAHQVTFLFSDRGTPRTYRNMNGYGSHTFTWVNAKDEAVFVKYHFKTDSGIESFTDAEAKAMTSEDPDFHRRDLREHLARGEDASWTLEMQVMPFGDAEGYRFNPFDVTKVWPHADYAPIAVGRLVLDRNPENHFAEVEQAAFEPANMVRGVGPSPDKMLLGRLFSYPDSHRHRIGSNYQELPINRPRVPVHSYNRDGAMRSANPADPVYAPNGKGGPRSDSRSESPQMEICGQPIRAPYSKHPEDDDFGQAGTLYRTVLSELERDHLASNIVGHVTRGVTDDVKPRVIEYWRSVDCGLGELIARGMGYTAR